MHDVVYCARKFTQLVGRTGLLFGVCLVAACASVDRPPAPEADALKELTDLMTGSFSSAKQAESDSQFYDIRLEMARIWPSRTDGVWLYVEQAAATALDKPYRQRVYRLTATELLWTSEVYELPEPAMFIGAWRTTERFEALEPEQLALRTGCAVYLEQPRSGEFRGSTRDQDCLSQLRGASYATSEVVITRAGITSWDRGYDATGKQVWGAVVAPYRFDRQ